MPTPRAQLAWSGVVAAGIGLATAELLAGVLPGARSPLVVVADQVISRLPARLVTLAIDLLGAANRGVLLTAMLVVAAGAGALAALSRRHGDVITVVVFGGFALLGVAAGLADPLVATITAVVAPTVGAAAGFALLLRWPGATERPDTDRAASERAAPSLPVEPEPIGLAPGPSRRELMTWTLTASAAAAAFVATGRSLRTRSAPSLDPNRVALPSPTDQLAPVGAATSFDLDGLSPVITPTDAFFRIDTAFVPPRIDAATHTVELTGMVARPLRLSYEELLARADTEADVTLTCVSNEVGGDLVGTARWQGVPLDALLAEAGVDPAADQIVGRSVDGWTAGMPRAVIDGRPALLAVGMNGQPLPVRHGFPVRLVVAGLYGYVSATKWLREIELTTFDAYDAYWVRRGWSRQGPVKTQSRIDLPRDGAIVPAGASVAGGVAWAGERGIERVEVSIDDNPWRPAELADPLSDSTWRLWRHDWEATPGSHTLRVRATDGSGQTQTAVVSPPPPDGATGHHTVRVRVR